MDNFDGKYKKKNPFSVPEGYFEQLDEQIIDRIKEKDEPQKVAFLTMVKPYFGLAAIFLLALLVVQFVLPRVIDPAKMLMHDTAAVSTMEPNTTEGEGLDRSFEPTNDEIIEYLVSEVNDYELFFAEIY